LTNVDLTTFIGDAVDTSCFQAMVILDWPKNAGDISGGRPTVFMLCLVSTVLMPLKIGATKGKKATDIGSSLVASSLQGG
jgi:hypothetical protein